ncbi:MAG: nucleotidyltransferase domain-containing protein [Bryobacterales bacterium]|nr:nucleotidyltransferase domain-containing protein [Bryobacterales bacterium]
MDGDRAAAGHEEYCSPKEAGSIETLEGFVGALRPLLEKQNASSCWVFGSHARGTAGSLSDIDLIVVAPSKRPFPERPLDYLGALRCAGAPVDILVYTPEEFRSMLREGRPFLSEALKTAVPVYVG